MCYSALTLAYRPEQGRRAMNTKTLRFILTRVLLAGFTLWVISVIAFVIMELLEGDAVVQQQVWPG